MENLMRAIFNKENQATYFDDFPKPVMDRLLRFVDANGTNHYNIKVNSVTTRENGKSKWYDSEFATSVSSSNPGFVQKWKECLLSSGNVISEDFGKMPFLFRLDVDKNAVKTPDLFSKYQQTISMWMSIKAADVIPDAPVEEQFARYVKMFKGECVEK